jgi:hypothetical protein
MGTATESPGLVTELALTVTSLPTKLTEACSNTVLTPLGVMAGLNAPQGTA